MNVNDNNTVQLELPPGSTVHPVFNLDKIEHFHSTDTTLFPLDSTRNSPQPLDSDSSRYSFDIVYFRDWSLKTSKTGSVRYYVRWEGYADSPGHPDAHGWAYETPDTVDMWLTTEQSYGIFPEKGITKKTRSRVRAHKLTVYGHVFPILVSTLAISKTAVRSRSSRRTLPPLPSNPSSLLLKVVEDARDVDNEAVYMAGQVLSYSSATSKFQLKWTDGTTSTLTLSEVVEILLPPTPVSVADSA